MPRVFQKTTRVVVVLGLISIFLLCLGSLSVMKRNEMGQMTDCEAARTAMLCPVSAALHLKFWQQIVVTTAPTTILLILILSAAALSFRSVINSLLAAARLKYTAWQLLLDPALVDYLKQAFAQGILRSKIYYVSFFVGQLLLCEQSCASVIYLSLTFGKKIHDPSPA